MYGHMVERVGVVMVAQPACDKVTAAEDQNAKHDERGQKIHEGHLVVMSKECNHQSCGRKESVSFEGHFDQILKSLSQGIGEVDVKLEVMEPLLTVGIDPINHTVSQLHIAKGFVEGLIVLHTVCHDLQEVRVVVLVGGQDWFTWRAGSNTSFDSWTRRPANFLPICEGSCKAGRDKGDEDSV
jgi:hypothetical protein